MSSLRDSFAIFGAYPGLTGLRENSSPSGSDPRGQKSGRATGSFQIYFHSAASAQYPRPWRQLILNLNFFHNALVISDLAPNS